MLPHQDGRCAPCDTHAPWDAAKPASAPTRVAQTCAHLKANGCPPSRKKPARQHMRRTHKHRVMKRSPQASYVRTCNAEAGGRTPCECCALSTRCRVCTGRLPTVPSNSVGVKNDLELGQLIVGVVVLAKKARGSESARGVVGVNVQHQRVGGSRQRRENEALRIPTSITHLCGGRSICAFVHVPHRHGWVALGAHKWQPSHTTKTQLSRDPGQYPHTHATTTYQPSRRYHLPQQTPP